MCINKGGNLFGTGVKFDIARSNENVLMKVLPL